MITCILVWIVCASMLFVLPDHSVGVWTALFPWRHAISSQGRFQPLLSPLSFSRIYGRRAAPIHVLVACQSKEVRLGLGLRWAIVEWWILPNLSPHHRRRTLLLGLNPTEPAVHVNAIAKLGERDVREAKLANSQSWLLRMDSCPDSMRSYNVALLLRHVCRQ